MKRFKNIQFVKFPEVDEVDNAHLVGLFERFISKIGLKEDDSVTLSHKSYAKGGLRKQHEIKAHMVLEGKDYHASDETWSLLDSVQNVIKKLEKEVSKDTSK